jgi:hypothetical protein
MTHEWLMDRKWRLETRTIGRLFDATSGIEEFLCYTGEDRVRPAGEAKVYGETAIPAGRYRVVLDFSDRFGKIMPHILDVKGFSGIRIHGARAARPVEFSTLGCPCVGMEHDSEGVYDCAPAMRAVVTLLEQAEKAHEEVWVTIA